MDTPTAPARRPACPCGPWRLSLVKVWKGSQCITAGSPLNSFKQDWIFGTYKINFIIHSLHVYILVEFLNNGIVNTPKLILIILTGATIHFCQVQVSKYNWMWKAILNLCYLQHKESCGPWLLRHKPGRTWPWTHKHGWGSGFRAGRRWPQGLV